MFDLEDTYSIKFESEDDKIEYIILLLYKMEFEKYKEYGKLSDKEVIIYNQLITKIKKIEEKIGLNDL